MEAFGEIELRRRYLGTLVPQPWRTHEIAQADALPESSVVAAVAIQRARGARVLLVTIESEGGSVPAAFTLYETFRNFSRAGGVVCVHLVGWNASTATFIALAGDFI